MEEKSRGRSIASLSPADARVIEYIAFVTQQSNSIERDAKKAAGVEDKAWLTYGDADRVEKERLAMGARLAEFLATASRMETDFELDKIVEHDDWPDNLTRLGIIRAKPAEYAPSKGSPALRGFDVGVEDVARIVQFLERRIEETEDLALDGLEISYLTRRDEKKQQIKLGVELTRFGRRLCAACGLL